MTSVFLSVAACKDKKEGEVTPVVLEESTTPSVEGSEVVYVSDTLKLKGYIAFDANAKGKRPGILVVHEWWGHNEYVRERADLLAEMGYTALAVDMYGNGKVAEHPNDAMKFTQEVTSDFEVAQKRFEAAMEVLQRHPSVDSEKIAAIGYCFGGSVVLSMANKGLDLDGVAAYHAGLGLPVMPQEGMQVKKVLVCNGADDPFISPESVTAFQEAMEKIDVPLEYHAYPGSVHAFTSKGADALGEKFGLPLAYNKEADSLSWASTRLFFEDIFR